MQKHFQTFTMMSLKPFLGCHHFLSWNKKNVCILLHVHDKTTTTTSSWDKIFSWLDWKGQKPSWQHRTQKSSIIFRTMTERKTTSERMQTKKTKQPLSFLYQCFFFTLHCCGTHHYHAPSNVTRVAVFCLFNQSINSANSFKNQMTPLMGPCHTPGCCFSAANNVSPWCVILWEAFLCHHSFLHSFHQSPLSPNKQRLFAVHSCCVHCVDPTWNI